MTRIPADGPVSGAEQLIASDAEPSTATFAAVDVLCGEERASCTGHDRISGISRPVPSICVSQF